MNLKNDILKTLLSGIVLTSVYTASATPTVTIDSVAQRWPWNNKVDITYTVGDGTDLAAFDYYKIVFTATVEGTEYTIDGSKDIIAKTVSGTHVVTWTNAPAGVRAADCKMGAKLYRTSGYYMIVDLDTGAFAFEGLEEGDTPTAIPTASNARYNTDLYKTDRLVLRRIPRTATADAVYSAGYPTGHTNVSYNQPTNWVTTSDYFIGVFDMTQAQYAKVMGLAPWDPMKPQHSVSWNTLRSSAVPGTTLGSNASSGSVFERLNAATGLIGFDLPTSVMFEIADRAGSTGRYFWNGNNADAVYTTVDGIAYTAPWNTYYVYYTAMNGGMAREVGTGCYDGITPCSNVWGLYDTIGNIIKILRDGSSLYDSDLRLVADAFIPSSPAGSNILVRWTAASSSESDANHPSSQRGTWGQDFGHDQIGFRASFRNMAP